MTLNGVQFGLQPAAGQGYVPQQYGTALPQTAFGLNSGAGLSASSVVLPGMSLSTPLTQDAYIPDTSAQPELSALGNGLVNHGTEMGIAANVLGKSEFGDSFSASTQNTSSQVAQTAVGKTAAKLIDGLTSARATSPHQHFDLEHMMGLNDTATISFRDLKPSSKYWAKVKDNLGTASEKARANFRDLRTSNTGGELTNLQTARKATGSALNASFNPVTLVKEHRYASAALRTVGLGFTALDVANTTAGSYQQAKDNGSSTASAVGQAATTAGVKTGKSALAWLAADAAFSVGKVALPSIVIAEKHCVPLGGIVASVLVGVGFSRLMDKLVPDQSVQ